MMITPSNEMIMVNVLTDSEKNVIFTAEKNSIVGTNAMFICLMTMLKDNGIADATVIKVSEYLNL
ncbi:hypothetical protein [Vibrio sp.]|uniref:hypothetical protein n=1 Tax=Vibrio sp. TaxID=678 RepID=UPI00311EE662